MPCKDYMEQIYLVNNLKQSREQIGTQWSHEQNATTTKAWLMMFFNKICRVLAFNNRSSG